jgi:hypothetical protein
MRGARATVGQVALVVATWVVAAAAVLAVAAETRVGPIVLTVTGRHGVHAGDVVAGVLCFAAAALLTGRIAQRRPATGP